jgi:hypothetical protein
MVDDELDIAFDVVCDGQRRLAVQRALALGLFRKVTRDMLDAP